MIWPYLSGAQELIILPSHRVIESGTQSKTTSKACRADHDPSLLGHSVLVCIRFRILDSTIEVPIGFENCCVGGDMTGRTTLFTLPQVMRAALKNISAPIKYQA